MKASILKGLLTCCFPAAMALGAQAQLPSEKAFPLVLRSEVKDRTAHPPPAVAPVALPSAGKKLPKGAALGRGQLPSSSGAPLVAVAERRKKLPSSAPDPGATLKRRRAN